MDFDTGLSYICVIKIKPIMTTKKNYLITALLGALVGGMFIAYLNMSPSKTTKEVNLQAKIDIQPVLQVGKSYKKSIIIDEKDPFSKPVIDTFIILDKKNGYVKFTKRDWMRSDTVKYWSSAEEKFFSKNCTVVD